MAPVKFDYLIEAVHFSGRGVIDTVRVYQRRGAAVSDHITINRAQLLEALQAGRTVVTGTRHEYLAGTFSISTAVKLAGPKELPVISIEGNTPAGDDLPGVPLL